VRLIDPAGLLSDGLRDDADVGLGLLPFAEEFLGLGVGDRAGDDDVLALDPVHRGRDLVVWAAKPLARHVYTDGASADVPDAVRAVLDTVRLG
jgi:hypothetical protein